VRQVEGSVAPVTGRIFTVSQFGVAARLNAEQAREFIDDFEERGVVERARGGWRFTPAGLEIARSFRWWGTDE
jgi:hypothetical protein